jgi:hypothetical protein
VSEHTQSPDHTTNSDTLDNGQPENEPVEPETAVSPTGGETDTTQPTPSESGQDESTAEAADTYNHASAESPAAADFTARDPEESNSQPAQTGLDRLDEDSDGFDYIQSLFTTALVESIPAEVQEQRLSPESELADVIAVIEDLEGTGKLQPLPDLDTILQTQPFQTPDYDLTQSGTEQLDSDTPLEETPLVEVPADVIEAATPGEAIDELREYNIVDDAPTQSPSSSTTASESQMEADTVSTPSAPSPITADPVGIRDEIVVLDTEPTDSQMRCLGCGNTQFVHLREPVGEWMCADCNTSCPPKISRQLTGILTAHTEQPLPAIEKTTPAPNDTDRSSEAEGPSDSGPPDETATAAADTTPQTETDSSTDDSDSTQDTDGFSLL